MRIAIDGMGGDHAPGEIVKGCVQASNQMEDEIYIVGPEETIRKELKKYRFHPGRIKIVNATQVITGEDAPVRAVRSKRDSSLVKSITLVKEGICDVVVSGGNTGALMAGSLFILGRIPGIERPAIGMMYPQIGSKPAFLVDAGANPECKPSQLLQFAAMGTIYMEKVQGIESPRVGLINIGVEEHKGTPVLKETYQLLKNSKFNFVGNIEAREIQNNPADIYVCDGFTGNNILKLTEGMGQKIMELAKKMFTHNTVTKLSALAMSSQLKDLKKIMDYSEYGGAPILGIRGAVIKIHGSSKAEAVKNGILRSRDYVLEDVVRIIDETIQEVQSEAEEQEQRETE